MSRVAKNPVLLPKEVEATVTDQTVILKGSQGTMSRDFSNLVEIINKDQRLCVSPKMAPRPAACARARRERC